MIAMLRGRILEKGPETVIVDVNGVGYEVYVPSGVLFDLGDNGSEVRLRTHLDVKEDQLQLYGFTTRDQLEMFRLLISVSKIGPRTALNVLSVMSAEGIANAVLAEDIKAFTSVPGIGKKTARRIFLDLGEKISRRWKDKTQAVSSSELAPGPGSGVWDTARRALSAQGFNRQEVDDRLAWARKGLGDDASIERILGEALRFRQ